MPESFFLSGFGVLLLDVLLKGALLLGLAHLGALCLRRWGAPASIRRAGWGLAFAGLFLLPFGAVFLPPVPLSEGIEHLSSSSRSQHVPVDIEPLFSRSKGEQSPREGPHEEKSTEVVERSTADTTSNEEAVWGWTMILCAVWGAGASFLSLRIGIGHVQIWRLRREARTVKRPEWTRLVRRLKRKMGIRRPIPLALHDGVAAPMCTGLTRPMLLLPSAAKDWSEERLRFVLQHEMTHVRHRDLVLGLFARLTRAIHWPNPLVWTGWKALRHTQELACDEAVLRGSCSFKRYARELIGVARETVEDKTRCHTPALPLARPVKLKRRIEAILRHGPSPRQWSIWAKSWACTLTLGAFLLVSAFRPLPDHLYPVTSDVGLEFDGLHRLNLSVGTAVPAGLGFGGNQGFWGDAACLESSPDWQSTGTRCWKKGVDTSTVFRNLESLSTMGLAGESIPMGLSQERFNHAIRHSLLELYRTNPEVVDSLFQRHAAPELANSELDQDVLGPNKNLRSQVLERYKKKAYRAITSHYQEPRQVQDPPEIPYPDSLRTEGIAGRIELEVYVNRKGEIGAVEVRRGLHPTLNAIAMDATRQAKWEPAYLYNEGKKTPKAAWVRVPISFSASK